MPVQVALAIQTPPLASSLRHLLKSRLLWASKWMTENIETKVAARIEYGKHNVQNPNQCVIPPLWFK